MRKLPNNSSGQALLTDCEIGQALLIILLSMSVVLTIVLSILARSTVDIGVSTRSEESVRAFSAAEAGIERALVIGGNSGEIGDARFEAKVTDYAENLTEFVLPSSLYSGESTTVWFVSHNANGNLSTSCNAENPCFTGSRIQVCWGKAGTSDSTNLTPAIEVSVIYLATPWDYTTARIARAAIDPYTSRNPPNSFFQTDGVTCEVDGQTFPFSKTINMAAAIAAGGLGITTTGVPGSLQLARISFLYNDDMGHPVAVHVPSGTLPAQGVVIDSSGFSGDSTRKVEVIRGFNELPWVFENVVFSQEGITK